MKRYVFAHPAAPARLAFEANNLREAKQMVISEVRQFQTPRFRPKWTPIRTSRTGQTAAWQLEIIDSEGKVNFRPGRLSDLGHLPPVEPGPMDTHMGADALLENLLKLHEKLNQ